jgi:hypothetical protein
MQFEECLPSLGLSQYDQGSSFCLLFLRVDCEYNRPSFLTTVFALASTFNGNLKQWDVTKVGAMQMSKSKRMVENNFDVSSCYCDWRVQSGVWVGGEDVT